MDSILAQTLQDIEVICIDDGSTDSSLTILGEYAERDSRLTIIQRKNGGAGAARNTGLGVARGDYLSFLDADDFFEPTMLEEAYRRCVADQADMGVYRARYFNTDTSRFIPADGLVRIDLLPETIPFSYKDIPDHIFNFVSPAPWTKMYRRAFVMEQGLRFQEIMRANDFLFTRLASVKAQRITVIDKVLVNYRIGNETNLQANNHRTPLAFHDAHVALRDELVKCGVFPEVERSFVNAILSNCLYNLHSLRTPEAFNGLYEKLRSEYFGELGVDGRDEEYFFSQRQYEQYQKIKQMAPEEYLLDELRSHSSELKEMRSRLKRTRAKLAKTKTQLSKVESSLSYRIGQGISYIPRSLKRLISQRRKEA
jgi:glycosyltransferase involved in cell wall biosynthesis